MQPKDELVSMVAALFEQFFKKYIVKIEKQPERKDVVFKLKYNIEVSVKQIVDHIVTDHFLWLLYVFPQFAEESFLESLRIEMARISYLLKVSEEKENEKR